MRITRYALPAAFACALTVALTACGKPAPVAPAKMEAIKAEPSEAVSGKVITARKKDEELKIKLKRDKNGDYSWEIEGRDATEIIKADKALKRRFQSGDGTGRSGDQ